MIEFFFDCSSPWTWLAFRNLQPIARELGETEQGCTCQGTEPFTGLQAFLGDPQRLAAAIRTLLEA